ERKASVAQVQFSPDGKKLFTSGYPSGIIQFWDVASGKELRRMDSPPGGRGSIQYALLTSDWKRLYVPVWNRAIRRVERDGKQLVQLDNTGAIWVWDVETGKQQPSLVWSKESAPIDAQLSPDSRFLVASEMRSYDASDTTDIGFTVVWDLIAGTKQKMQ